MPVTITCALPSLLQLTRLAFFAQQLGKWRDIVWELTRDCAFLCIAAILWGAADCLSAAGFVLPSPAWWADVCWLMLLWTAVDPICVSLWAAWRARRLCLAAAGPRVCRLARAVRHNTARRPASPGSPPA